MKLVYKILLVLVVLAVNVFPQELNQRLGKNNSTEQIQSITWSALGAGVDGDVNAIAICGDYIYAGGSFSHAGGVSANNIARWNTTTNTWSAIGTGVNDGVDGPVYAIAIDQSGYAGYQYVVYVGGGFTQAGGVSVQNIAGLYNFEGDEYWRALGAGVNSTVFAFALDITYQYGYLYVGGNFTSAGGMAANHIATYDSGNDGPWITDVDFSPGVDGDVRSIVVSGSNVYIGGEFANSGTTSLSCIASFNTGTIEWSPLGNGMSGTGKAVYAISLSGSNIYAGGVFDHAGGVSANNIAKWNGSSWSALGNGITYSEDTPVVDAIAVHNNYVYTSGWFNEAGIISTSNIARWDGISWSALGSGVNSEALSVIISGNDIYTGGSFTEAEGNSANHIAKILDTDFFLPIVTTNSITNISLSTATGGGNVTNNGGFNVSARGVCWSISQYPTIIDNHTSDGTGTGSFTSSLTGLTEGTVYHVRAYATNYYGTSYGSDVSFITFSSSPGTALSFGGINKYVNIPDDNTLDLTTNYTIEAWIEPEAFSNMGGIVSKYQTAGADGYFLRLTSTGDYNGLTFDGMSTSNGILITGNWYHVAAVNNGGTRHLYLNGVEQALTGTALNVSANTDPLCIGVDFKSSGRYFIGNIDEVRIWNVARSEQEIREDMHNTLDSDDTGLVSYWQFNDGTGSSTLGDAAGGHDGTLTNMDASNCWVSSTIPAGGGSSSSQNNFTNGTATTGDIQITTTDDFDNAVNLVGTEINRSPNTTSGIDGNKLDKYFLIHDYGTPGNFSTNITFTLPEGSISAEDQATPSNLKLYRREGNSDSDWSLITSASSVTSTTVTFDGITSFSQFTIGSSTSPLPVELTSFTTASTSSTGSPTSSATIELKWETATEVNNYGFDIERQMTNDLMTNDGNSHSSIVNSQWQKIGFVKGSGNSNSPKEYSFIDKTVLNGKYFYRLKQIDNDGGYSYSKEVEVKTEVIPTEFAMFQNYPNPFNPSTVISWQLAVGSYVTLKVYDVLGNEVATLVNEYKEAGHYNYELGIKSAAADYELSSGIYFYTLRTDNFVQTKKMILLK